jgi:hypothetical protein
MVSGVFACWWKQLYHRPIHLSPPSHAPRDLQKRLNSLRITAVARRFKPTFAASNKAASKKAALRLRAELSPVDTTGWMS